MPHVLQATLTTGEYEAVYNALSMTIAAMGASATFFFLRSLSVSDNYKSAVAVSGLVCMIACYHYFRIFNSWDDAYSIHCDYTSANATGECDIKATGAPFNDAYRYMDWFLTVPLLLIELVLVMNLPQNQVVPVCTKLGVAAATMIILGYPGETSSKNGTRWLFWVLAMLPFSYVVYTLFVGLKKATFDAPDRVAKLIRLAQIVTIVSWLTYPVVFILPMCGLSRQKSEVGIQVGYTFSDIISKCGVGFIVTHIAGVRSKLEGRGLDGDDRLINA